MIRHFPIVCNPFDMSQQLVRFSVRFLVLFFVLLAEQGTAINITRYTTGDVFQNTDSSQSCNGSGADCFFDGLDKSPFCEKNCCYCSCRSQTPTYVVSQGKCSTESQLMSILKSQNSSQGCDHRMVLDETNRGNRQCGKELLTTLNTRTPGNKSLFFCPWKTQISALHYKLAKKLRKCDILPNLSRYLYNGSWVDLSRAGHTILANLQVIIQQDPTLVDNDRLVLKWTADIGRQYDGLIFSLRLQCRQDAGNQEKDLNSCVFFKKSGSVTDIKPTFLPATKSTRARSTPVQRTASTSSGVSSMSVTHAPTPHVVNVTSNQGRPPNSALVVILAALAGALFVVLACVGLLFLLWKRKRRYQTRKGNSKASNPIYERRTSETLTLAKITIKSDEDEEDIPEYQPLVENTKPRDRVDSLPGYRALSIDQRANQRPEPNRGIRSSNYLSLIKDDDMEEGRNYQTLVKDEELQALDPIEEEKIPDYQEIEDRTDSEDTFSQSHRSSTDSMDYEEPPAEAIAKNNLNNPVVPKREHLRVSSTEVNDYDEPEGIIGISDNEENQAQEHVNNHNFHDYADPDDNRGNQDGHVDVNHDVTGDHDYDDPAE